MTRGERPAARVEVPPPQQRGATRRSAVRRSMSPELRRDGELSEVARSKSAIGSRDWPPDDASAAGWAMCPRRDAETGRRPAGVGGRVESFVEARPEVVEGVAPPRSGHCGTHRTRVGIPGPCGAAMRARLAGTPRKAGWRSSPENRRSGPGWGRAAGSRGPNADRPCRAAPNPAHRTRRRPVRLESVGVGEEQAGAPTALICIWVR